MADSVFGPGFDLMSYASERALELQDLKDRVFYKAAVEKMMLELFQHIKEEQAALEGRIFSEIRAEKYAYAIYIGLTDRGHYDASDEFLVPICSDDVKAAPISIAEALDDEAPRLLSTFFVQHNAQEVRRFGASVQTFQGTIETDAGEFQAFFRVRQSTRYLEQVAELYHIYLSNRIPWTTACTAYLHKMFDVFLERVEGLEEKRDAKIQHIKVDFGAYEEYVKRDIVPLWNLPVVEKNTSIYPVPCADHTHFEHIIFAHRLKAGCRYLVKNDTPSLQGTRYLNGDLYITCANAQPAAWSLFQVNPRPLRINYPYPVLSNQPQECFSADLKEHYRQGVKTKGELRRVIESYGYGGVVEFQDAELCPAMAMPAQTYDMDDFITDEFRTHKNREVMLLRFGAIDPENYLNLDIISFLVTQAQKLFPEYVCRGVLE